MDTNNGPYPPRLARMGLGLVGIFLSLGVLYVLSVGPAFWIASRHCDSTGMYLCRNIYRPLFQVAPEMTGKYCSGYGLSDIEIFGVLETAQGEQTLYKVFQRKSESFLRSSIDRISS